MAAGGRRSLAYPAQGKTDLAEDDSRLHEYGAIGYGPASKQLNGRVAEQMTIRNCGFGGRDVAFEIQPLDAARSDETRTLRLRQPYRPDRHRLAVRCTPTR